MNLIGILLLLALSTLSQSKVTQLNAKKWTEIIEQQGQTEITTPYKMVYFYSSSCPFCQEFNPKYQKLENQLGKLSKQLILTKIDGNAFIQISQKYKITSYPTIALFISGVSEPVYHVGQRQVSDTLQFIKKVIDYQLTKIPQQQINEKVINNSILIKAPKDSVQYRSFKVMSLRDKFKPIGFIETDSNKTTLSFYGQQYSPVFNKQRTINYYEREHRRKTAGVYLLDEEPWLRIHYDRDPAIVFVNSQENNKIISELVYPLAKKYPQVVFLDLRPDNDQFKQALKYFQINSNFEQFIGVDQKTKAKFEMTEQQAKQPFTLQNLESFVLGVLNRSQPLLRKSQKSANPHKLTRANYDQKFDNNLNNDIILFIYSTETQQDKESAKKIISLFNHLLKDKKLQQNSKLQMLRCDAFKNQIEEKLGVVVGKGKALPKIFYYRHRMKDRPIYFNSPIISAQTIMSFIMQNTTHDWEGFQL